MKRGLSTLSCFAMCVCCPTSARVFHAETLAAAVLDYRCRHEPYENCLYGIYSTFSSRASLVVLQVPDVS